MPMMSLEVIVDVSGTLFPVKVYHTPADNRGWTAGRIETLSGVDHYESYIYEFEAKVYDLPSKNGIDGGCISKLFVTDMRTDAEVIGYDRGWYLEPHCPQEYAALNALLTIFDTPQEWEVLD